MNITKEEFIMLREVCTQHIEVLESLSMRPLSIHQQHSLAVTKSFLNKLKNVGLE